MLSFHLGFVVGTCSRNPHTHTGIIHICPVLCSLTSNYSHTESGTLITVFQYRVGGDAARNPAQEMRSTRYLIRH
jgi:hypothetical protein